MHGGDIYSTKIKHDFSININPYISLWDIFLVYIKSFSSINKYPDYESIKLKAEISKKYDIPFSNIIVGNGASEIIMAIVKTIMPKTTILISPCFLGYIHALKSVDSKNIFFTLDEKDDFDFTSKKIIQLQKVIKEKKPDLLFLCNPNNPNGKLYSKETIIKILCTCKKTKTYVVLDECFINLTGKANDFSLKNNIGYFNNLIIVNAFTKTFSIPGIRLGFSFCNSIKINSKIKKQIPEWNISSIAQIMGVSLLKKSKEKDIKKNALKIEKEKNYLTKNLLNFGFKVYSSSSNFILFYSKTYKDLKEKLLKRNILIRDCSDYENLKKGFYRIAIKNHGKNKILITSIKKILKEN